MRQHPATTLALAVAGCTALWSVQASAQTSSQPSLEQLQQQIQQLQQQVQDMKTQQQNQQTQAASTSSSNNGAAPQQASSEGPKKSLNVGGGVAVEYQVQDHDAAPDQRDGGNLIFDYFSLNFSGQYGKLTYAAEERFSTVNFADSSFLHYGWAAYDFNDHNQLKGGYFQVPFGMVKDIGYQTFWGNLTYFAGFTDNQAAGLGYKYENGGWRVDLDAFKNDDLQQNSLYGSNPFQGYQQINGGNGRIGYTFNKDGDNWVDVSAAARGGQLEVGNSNDNGTRWAATVAADARIGLWTVQGQVVGYKYNIPDDRSFNGAALSTQAITVENYGFGYQVPASGEIYSFNVARDFPVQNMGPIDKFQVYNNYSYLHSGEGDYDEFGNRIGDVQFNAVGGEMVAGPVYIWADMLIGKNSAMTFVGPNDGDWHPRFNLTAAIYFDGDLVK
ncbi:hypothetical protein [Salinisphaera sp. Q1T1-3]|uniref:hypothetical protein n=1 Tax=Salinisphaera sp. Q1T1-3 TaxID=2321229 RepID=UPI0011C3D9E5|nr:hypothetical protein [Salinisphaera sp. Q1T1-3]